jgi:hypothetical protein
VIDFAGAPEEIRTPDPQIRSLVLYPAELRALDAGKAAGSSPRPGIAIGSIPTWQGSDRAPFRSMLAFFDRGWPSRIASEQSTPGSGACQSPANSGGHGASPLFPPLARIDSNFEIVL